MGKPKQRRPPKEKAPRGNDAPVRESKHVDRRGGARAGPSVPRLFLYLVKAVLLTTLSVPFWCLTGSLSMAYGRPPKMVFVYQTWRFLHYAIAGKHDLPWTSRVDLVMTIVLHSATSRVSGFCWLLDEILYGRQLTALTVAKPLFVLSAYRSASTQMARALASDTQRFAAPNAIMCAFPYLWLWKLAVRIVGDDSGMSTDDMNVYLNKNFSKESLERHDNDYFAVDTFDGYFLGSHLNGLAFQLGPDVIAKEFNSSRFEEHNRALFETSFVDHVDRLARKTLLFRGVRSSSAGDRAFLLKGHFLSSAEALRRRYPDARFLTVLRDPCDRLRSGINHTAVNATLWQGQPPRWEWLASAFRVIEVSYCEREMEWYGSADRGDSDPRLAVPFDAFVKDYHKTMERVYRDLLESTDEDAVPKCVLTSSKPPNKRYTVNRSLKELGVDEAGVKRQLMDYYAWLRRGGSTRKIRDR